MAMFRWQGAYINPADVAVIYTGTDSSKGHSHYMKVETRSGKEYRMNYATANGRDLDAFRLSEMVNNCTVVPVTKQEVEDIVHRSRDAIRRDIKALMQLTYNSNKEN